MLLDILRSLGLGGQIVTAATVAIAAWYLVKGARVGSMVAGLFGSAIGYAVAVLAAAALAIGLGWVDLHPAAMLAQLAHATTWVVQSFGDMVIHWIQSTLPG